MVYYNEIDPFAAEWLRILMWFGLIPYGVIDTRDIRDVRPAELLGYTQHHFFAGVGGWAYALRLAGWPDDRPVWTGSCPCQPFSSAGRRKGTADERHLWPHWFHLIEQYRPPTIFGEQVASTDGLGWLDIVQADLEGAGYACGAVDLCAAGVGAPQIRQRLWFVAERVGDAVGAGLEGYPRNVDDPSGWTEPGGPITEAGSAVGMAHHDSQRRDGQRVLLQPRGQEQARTETTGRDETGQPGPTNGFWSAADWLFCRDGKWRPVEPGTFPLADGVPNRVGRLRGYGNAIVPQVAAEVIASYMETEHA